MYDNGIYIHNGAIWDYYIYRVYIGHICDMGCIYIYILVSVGYIYIFIYMGNKVKCTSKKSNLYINQEYIYIHMSDVVYLNIG